MRRYLRAKSDFFSGYVVVGAAYPWLRDAATSWGYINMTTFLNREIDEGDSGLEEKYQKHTITTTIDDGAGRKLEDWRPLKGDFVVCGPGVPLMVVDAWCEGTLRVLDVDLKYRRVKEGECKPAVGIPPQVHDLASVYGTMPKSSSLPNGLDYVATFPLPFPRCVSIRLVGLPDGVSESDATAMAHKDFFANLIKHYEECIGEARKQLRC